MTDPKPLRIEDQLALQARNAELERELMKMKTPKDLKSDSEATISIAPVVDWIGLSIMILFCFFRIWGSIGPVSCYEISNENPWGPFKLDEFRKDWPTSHQTHTDKEFQTEEEGREFMRQWNLKECK